MEIRGARRRTKRPSTSLARCAAGLLASEAETFWSGFLKSSMRRGLKGVQLVVSDAHEGLKQAIAGVLGAS